MKTLEQVEEKFAGLQLLTQFSPHQVDAFHQWQTIVKTGQPRICLRHPTGKGKTISSLMLMDSLDVTNLLVIAPPSTHPQWSELLDLFGWTYQIVSHAKFRQKNFAISKSAAIICDEFHLLGGRGKMGFKKIEALSKYSSQPIVIMSATPQYNGAERVFCILSVTAPKEIKGGYPNFLFRFCIVEHNPFSAVPDVKGFQPDGQSADDFLKTRPDVAFLDDTAQYEIEDIPIQIQTDHFLSTYGLDRRTRTVANSSLQKHHFLRKHLYLTDNDILQKAIRKAIYALMKKYEGEKIIFFAQNTDIAYKLHHYLANTLGQKVVYVSGKTKDKEEALKQFKDPNGAQYLIGTASISTGTDGLDTVCNVLVLVQDVWGDAAQRRQIVGRILPRGVGTEHTEADKKFYRICPEPLWVWPTAP